MHDYPVPSDDDARRVLVEHNITEDRIQSVRLALLRWFARRPPEQQYYMLPRVTSDQDESTILTSRDMVNHLIRFTGIGRSYVELFIVGGLTNPHVNLEEVLARLENDK